jgi:hypothetical protein
VDDQRTAPRGAPDLAVGEPSKEAPAASAMLCPSAQPDLSGARAIGVIDHDRDEPLLAFLEEPLPVTDDLLALASPLRPTQVFRFAAACQGDACSHWNGTDCKLVDRIVELLPVSSLTLPSCRIRPECRWYAQRGRAACTRCPQIVTQNEQPSDEMKLAAEPPRGSKTG